MRIYTEVVWSWDDEKGELVRESSKSYDYEGSLTLLMPRIDDGNSPSVESTIAANALETGDAFVYPLGLSASGPTEYPHYIRFIAKRSFTSTTSRRGQKNGEVVLYMPPDALKTSYSQSIGDVEFGGFISLANSDLDAAGASLAAGDIKSSLKAAGVLKGNVEGSNAVNAVKDFGKAALGGALKVAGASSTGGQAISKATGQILNPHKAIVYQGPGGFRTFSYSFVMVPKSPVEAKEIFNIVRFFKKRMHPGTGAGAAINSSVTLSYPDEFEIKYYVNRKEVDGSSTTPLFKIHDCFMDSFGVDYTTSGLTSFTDDEQPLTTTMTMSFKETQLLTKSDIDAGY